MKRVKLTLQRETQLKTVPSKEQVAQYLQLVLETSSGEVTVRFVDADESQQLNRHYRKKDQPTNVLAFPYHTPTHLGDIVLCAPVILNEAKMQDKSLEAHWAHLIIHGGLHLIGYDHQKAEEAELMEAKEIKLLHQLGYSNPYQEEGTHHDR